MNLTPHCEDYTGTWWLKGDTWYRQWQSWSYGELLGFEIYINDNRIHWVRDGQLVDAAFYTIPGEEGE